MSYYTGGRKAPYAFHHVQNLTDNSAEFIRLVRNQDTRGNVDSPESGMDALMQAIVCDGIVAIALYFNCLSFITDYSRVTFQPIQCSRNVFFILEHIWKTGIPNEGARKIIIFVTDQSSHYALDGLLGGIVTPAGTYIIIHML